MTADVDLFSWRQARGQGRGPDVSAYQLDLFIAALAGHRWRTAAHLSQTTGLSDRKLRALAEISDARIISGQRGYCLAAEATVDEIRHASDWMISQGKRMIRRGIAIKRQAHHRLS